ncbi:hypothetical protein X777_09782 [Ooceraea biroi]|uniref:Uncharacterized protein n=1 Tax=Ooceraea biroi TaxID=2015173 RepID=A0A026W643_OOCBI|nr:hypothetical protein X777_09782 [Ooceraea biroi]
MNSHTQLQGSWEDLATFLNSLKPNGKEKDVKSWKTNAIQELTAGNENILNEMPVPIIIPELEDISIDITNENEGELRTEQHNPIAQNIIDPCISSSQGRNVDRLGVQLYDARESFGTIADKHAEALMVSVTYLFSAQFDELVNKITKTILNTKIQLLLKE